MPSQAYHVFSAYLLERLAADAPWALDSGAHRLRGDVARYTLAMMAPDGQLTVQGRSLEQSWTLAAAAALGARRAASGGRDAAAWRSFADRAFSRLVRVYGVRADGTIPIVPGLRHRWDARMMDPYAQMSQYDGLTLWLLADAARFWPAAGAERGALPADRSTFLVDDVRGSGMAWGRGNGVWWSVQARSTAFNARFDQGIVAVKRRGAGGRWADRVAARPIRGMPRTAWTLSAGGRAARLSLNDAGGRGTHARLRGSWRRADGSVLRQAEWDLRVVGGGLRASVAMRHGESLSAAVWRTSPAATRARGASSRTGACTVSASGPACPVVARWQRPGTAAFTIR
jgi:hypothetical protein